ncbi:hypothetical protein GX618_00875 [Candidatus Dojkabacteria bacterium]|uniref:Uncharacterized protein n=1 Tax=Candidatus Dojkabacteria bacterium TaxID=2099670 RepID=A0A847EU27_9BACT|nr:hypothetical protein [Candidatus Dojkabacteria bacterium]
MEISQDIKSEKSPNTVKRLLSIILVIVIFVVGVGSGYLVYNRLSEKNSRENGSVDKQITEILEELGSLILLPKDETPTVMSVMDVDSLKKENEEFYKDVVKGDILIIYSDKAIIFRREEKKIVNVAPVFIETDELSE